MAIIKKLHNEKLRKKPKKPSAKRKIIFFPCKIESTPTVVEDAKETVEKVEEIVSNEETASNSNDINNDNSENNEEIVQETETTVKNKRKKKSKE